MKKMFLVSLCALAFVLSFSLIPAVPALANTINVSPGESIQAAIDAASSGDTIQVAAGIYPEQLIINKAGLTIEGDGSYPMVQPPLNDSNKYDTVIKALAADITIRGLDISKSTPIVDLQPGTIGHIEHHAIWDAAWTLGPGGLTVDDCIIHDIEHGVRNYGPDLTVTNSEFYLIRRGGVYASGYTTAKVLPVTIKDNYFHDFLGHGTSTHKKARAIHLKYYGRVGEISGNYMAGMRYGIWINTYSSTDRWDQPIVIIHNTFDQESPTAGGHDYGWYGPAPMVCAFTFCGAQDPEQDIIIEDNIIANTLDVAVWGRGRWYTTHAGIKVDNNLFYNVNPEGHVYTMCGGPDHWYGDSANLQVVWGGADDAYVFSNNKCTEDPLFAYTGTTPEEYWALQSGSPARKAASDGTDIGAWQSPPNARPVADANGPYSGYVGMPITFDAAASNDPDGTIVLYEWDFNGDGVYDYSTTDPTIAHTWSDSYTGNVGLKVTDDGGLTATATTTVGVIGAHDLKQEALDELNGLLPTGDDKLDKKLDKAMEHIQKSLNIDPKDGGQWEKHDLWLDDNHLDPKHGSKVFNEEKQAIKELKHLMNEKHTPQVVKDVCQKVIDELTKADYMLARTAIDDAIAGGGDAKEIAKAEEEMTKAQEELNHTKKDGTPDPHYDKAIDHYKKAWEHACKPKKTQAAATELLAVPGELKVVAYPNPIRDVHTATFQARGTLAVEVEEIRVQIYDLSGRLVWENAALGSELDWHTDSLSGDYLANGIYLYRVQVRIGGNWINQDIGKIAVLR
jgi:hypothetical protein